MGGFIHTIEPEKAVLVGVSTSDQPLSQVEEYLDELAFLVETAGAIPVKRLFNGSIHPIPAPILAVANSNEIKQFVKDNAH